MMNLRDNLIPPLFKVYYSCYNEKAKIFLPYKYADLSGRINHLYVKRRCAAIWDRSGLKIPFFFYPARPFLSLGLIWCNMP